MTDDDLRARIRRADPAAAWEPASPDEVARLLEKTMIDSTTPVVPKMRHYALAAAALVLVAAAGAGWLITQRGPDPVTVRLNAPGGFAAKCLEPSVERLAASADFAMEGTVEAVSDSTVTIDVTRVFHGADADRVEVDQAGEISEQLMGTGKFETGKDYLVASYDGTVMTCGYSGEATAPGLRDLYERAFPR
ncbi:hypothetical protein AMIS_51410 [Actinoplanes missouriensis 431]|uniref:Uncharacterized protein n=1 Tax=Actinoplanes missouriensis (strain ATCC 14538 / DSM 43046 / CBS 188.64 / JCM 3121 / NBRC 102363 / NCIMB 12654 / NRRL B-3342 / UNCC 431) TaxID=512565 RepID=I0HBH4_ACTM4|nr:hypothetical protein [Actinoplanes missouriensis]BAL90361.1 hypothetical protein AMIS_51410 [Actinoplanes missouriensis 431]